LGDPDYGNERINDKFDVQRPLLHAYNLTLHHPLTKEKISFKSKLPGDFLEVLETHFPKSPPWDKL
jgi:23S rRNA-/tRNA-specific pseudouridylate synthase